MPQTENTLTRGCGDPPVSSLSTPSFRVIDNASLSSPGALFLEELHTNLGLGRGPGLLLRAATSKDAPACDWRWLRRLTSQRRPASDGDSRALAGSDPSWLLGAVPVRDGVESVYQINPGQWPFGVSLERPFAPFVCL
jgi:hypothetical protein